MGRIFSRSDYREHGNVCWDCLLTKCYCVLRAQLVRSSHRRLAGQITVSITLCPFVSLPVLRKETGVWHCLSHAVRRRQKCGTFCLMLSERDRSVSYRRLKCGLVFVLCRLNETGALLCVVRMRLERCLVPSEHDEAGALPCAVRMRLERCLVFTECFVPSEGVW